MVSAELNQNGEPELFPRVGDEYQAEIPALITGPEYDSYLKKPVDAENKDHVPFDFLVGLSVPVTWIRNINKVAKNKKEDKLEFSSQLTDAPSILGSVRETIDPCYILVPGICHDSWYDIEEASFVLGLYLFKKKFVELKKFIGSKKMGDLLFFYHTKFYSSPEFNRWSTSSKGRKRKCAYGQRLFRGSKHQELLSRLLPRVSEEYQQMLREVTKTYEKKDMSIVEYIFSLKSLVGLETFVDAVAIGKGEQDLTGMVIRPVQIPVGEACSYLTYAEIVKFLTGGYRLSKPQSSDLFWEAVWPRLLARGWHSEQPKNQKRNLQCKMDSLVFLPPGVEKFSRKLVEGNHYFDSVTSVLSKVGSEPELLELDTEKDEWLKYEEKGFIEETMEQQNLPKKRSCYLQPQTPICDMDVMKFTVTDTDTSLDNKKKLKFRDSETLPIYKSEMKFVSKESDKDTSNASTIKSDCARNMLVDQESTHAKILPDKRQLFYGSSDQLVQIDSPDIIEPEKEARKQEKLYDNHKAREPVHIQLSQTLKRNNLDTLLSVTKKHRSTAACSNEDIGSGSSTFPLVLKSGDRDSKAFSQVGSSTYRWEFSCSPEGNPCWSTRGSQDNDCHDQENPQSSMFMHLNLPQQPADFPCGVFLTDSTNMQDDITSAQQNDFCDPKTSSDISVPEKPTHMNSRRQGTRNRPPTSRALEALVNGDLTVKTRRKKDVDAH